MGQQDTEGAGHKPNDLTAAQLVYVTKVRHARCRYAVQWRLHGFVHNVLYGIISAGAVAVPFLLNIPAVPKWLTTSISAAVAVAAALVSVYKFGERRHIYRQLQEAYTTELEAYDAQAGNYKGLDPAGAFQRLFSQTQLARAAAMAAFFALVRSQPPLEPQPQQNNAADD